MSQLSPQEVQRLRKATGAGMMDAKRALEEAGGDFEAAAELLRKKGLADARKRADRASDQGAIGHYLHMQTGRPVIGVLVELRCETDFVAKTEDFQEAARQLAMHIAAARPDYGTVDDVPAEVLDKERQIVAEQARREDKPENVVERIVEGKLRSFYQERVLAEQQFVNTDRFDGTVGELVEELSAKLGEHISVGRFARVAVGEAGG